MTPSTQRGLGGAFETVPRAGSEPGRSHPLGISAAGTGLYDRNRGVLHPSLAAIEVSASHSPANHQSLVDPPTRRSLAVGACRVAPFHRY
jgi:hypothetical protein